ncbi:hypothetical protein C8R44DRAFT_750561 [Mycena epipterygia]|nr:hypothetical protein C8R44DRAFT_750561 [Mycena epipterygia]
MPRTPELETVREENKSRNRAFHRHPRRSSDIGLSSLEKIKGPVLIEPATQSDRRCDSLTRQASKPEELVLVADQTRTRPSELNFQRNSASSNSVRLDDPASAYSLRRFFRKAQVQLNLLRHTTRSPTYREEWSGEVRMTTVSLSLSIEDHVDTGESGYYTFTNDEFTVQKRDKMQK